MFSVDKRWAEHCRESRKERCEKRPLYSAMNKYGVENFTIEEVEKCSENILSEREKYWIEYFNSFKRGYNATSGGDGTKYIDYDTVIETYKGTGNQNTTAEILGISPSSVRNILKLRKVDRNTAEENNRKTFGMIIDMFSLNGDYIKTFDTSRDAARYILNDNDRKSSIGGVADHILDVCKGKRRTAYGYIWKFAIQE